MFCFFLVSKKLQIDKDLKEILEWSQLKESEIDKLKSFSTLEQLETSIPLVIQIALDARDKKPYFEDQKLSPVSYLRQ